jgi:hypothetical protein
MADSFTEDELVGHVRAGARDCVRRGDARRLDAAVERERPGGAARGAHARRFRPTATRRRATAR